MYRLVCTNVLVIRGTVEDINFSGYLKNSQLSLCLGVAGGHHQYHALRYLQSVAYVLFALVLTLL